MPRTLHELRAIITANADTYFKVVNQTANAAVRLGTTWGTAASSVATSGARITAAIGGIGFLAVTIARKFAQAGEEQAVALRKVEAVITATGSAAGKTVEDIERFAASRQKVTDFGDEVTAAGAAILLTFKSIRGEAFERTMVAAQDLSSLFGQDLQSSIVQLGKALEDPKTGLLALRRVGISFTEAEKEKIKALVESNQKLEAQAMILQAVESQVGGTAERISRPWVRFTNILSDVAENIGTAIMPAFDAIGSIGGDLFGPLAADVGRFEEVGARIAAFFAENRASIVSTLNGVVEQVQLALPQLATFGTEMLGVAESVGTVIKAVGEFLLAHPRLAAALLALKGAQMLGVTKAVSDLGRALVETARVGAPALVSILKSLPSILSAVKTAGLAAAEGIFQLSLKLIASKAAMATLGAAAVAAFVYVAAKAIYNATDAVKDFNREMQRSEMLADRQAKATLRRQNAIIREAGALQGEDKTAFLSERLEESQADLDGYVQRIKEQQVVVERLTGMWGDKAEDLGGKNLEAEQQTLKELQRQFELSQDFLDTLKDQLADSTAESARAAAAPSLDHTVAGSSGAAEAPGESGATSAAEEFGEEVADAVEGGLVSGMSKGEKKAAETIGKAIDDAATQAIDDAHEGFKEMRDFIGQKGVTSADVEAFAATQGADADLAANMGSQFDELGGAKADPKALDTLVIAFRDIINGRLAQEEITGPEGTLRQAQVKAIEDEAPGFGEVRDFMGQEGVTAEMVQAFVETLKNASPEMAEQYAQWFADLGVAPSTQMLDDLAKELATDLNAATTERERFADALQTSDEAMSDFDAHLLDLSGKLPVEDLQRFGDSADGLVEGLMQGHYTTDQFSAAMGRLRESTNAAVEAADRKAKQEQRDAIMSGDFGALGEDFFNEQFEQRLYNQQMQNLNAELDEQFQLWAMMNGIIPQVADGFEQLQGNIDSFGQGVGQAAQGQQLSAEAVANAMRQLSSVQGQMASITATIQLLLMNLAFVDTYRQRAEILEQIALLQQRIEELKNLPGPAIIGPSSTFDINDPGLQTGTTPAPDPGGGRIGQSANISFSFPNLTRIGNAEASHVFDVLKDEAERRGFSLAK